MSGRIRCKSWEMRNAFSILVESKEEKRLLGRLRRRRVDNIKTDLKEIE
jgi:hypothetical protein